MELVFWISAAFIAYVYVGYPLVLMVWARVRPQPPVREDRSHAPAVSIVIAARNEAPRLPARLDNLLQIPYDAPRQIIVVSDGSTDGTVDALERYKGVV